eukprot:ANDGO_06478.mRNA.1 putative RNA-binding protein C328.05
MSDSEANVPAENPAVDAAPSAAGTLNPQRRECRVYVGNLPFTTQWFDLKTHMRAAGEVTFTNILLDPMGRSKGCGIVEYATVQEAHAAIEMLNESTIKGRKIFVREDRDTPKSAVVAAAAGGVVVGSAAGAGAQGAEGAPSGLQQGHAHPHHGHSHQRPYAFASGSEGQQHPRFGAQNNAGAQQGGSAADTSAQSQQPQIPTKDRQLFVKNLSWGTTWQELKDHFRTVGNVVRADVLRKPDSSSRGIGIILMESPNDARRAIETLNGSTLNDRQIAVDFDKRSA